jgi:hypothetical protein
MSIDVEIHVAHHGHKTGHNWVDMVVAFSALFVSVVSLYGAGTNTVDGVTALHMRVYSSGVGPAKIEYAELIWKGVAYRGNQEFLEACCGLDPASAVFDSDLLSSVVLRAGLSMEFLGFKKATNPAVFAALQQVVVSRDLQLHVCYCSIFDECWKNNLTTLSLKPEPVQACARPKVPFDQGLLDRNI